LAALPQEEFGAGETAVVAEESNGELPAPEVILADSVDPDSQIGPAEVTPVAPNLPPNLPSEGKV
jgi:hypothetical protein